jgi:cell wall-associated NlpC family hydrolase
VELYHSASAQKNSGVKVDSPLRGDLVSFGYNADTAGHIGIYVSEDVMIHVGRPGQRTSYRSISEFGKFYGEIIYTRILDTE